MREIKFRDFDLETKTIRYFDLDHYDKNDHDCYGNIMQFTGLKDKNGVGIFEGDILDCGWIVSFNDGMFGIFDISHYMGINQYMADYRKVIGNIHENKELL